MKNATKVVLVDDSDQKVKEVNEVKGNEVVKPSGKDKQRGSFEKETSRGSGVSGSRALVACKDYAEKVRFSLFFLSLFILFSLLLSPFSSLCLSF